MKDEFKNRLGMFRTVLTTLDEPAHRAVWEGQKPLAFERLVQDFRTNVSDLETLIREQEEQITGLAEEKRREEDELEEIAHEIGVTLGVYFRSQGQEGEAAAVTFAPSNWQKLQDETLVARSGTVLEKLRAALDADPAGLSDYGLNEEDAEQLEKERNDFLAVINNPQAAIAARKALTQSARPRFREVNNLLEQLDALILRHRRTPEGRKLVENYQTARIIRDLGS